MNEFVALPPGVVTITLNIPAERAGVVQMILFEESIEIFEASTPPNLTEVTPETKPVPVIVTVVPPTVEPETGETEEIVGEVGGPDI